MAQIRENANIVYPPHAEVFVENVMTFFVQQELLDLVFVCKGNIQVSVHKVVFASVSRFLSEIVNLNPQDVLYISLPDVDHKSLRILVHFLYEGVTKVTFEEMMVIKEVMALLCIQLKNAEIRAINPIAETASSFSFNDIKFDNIETGGNVFSQLKSHQIKEGPLSKTSRRSKLMHTEAKLSKSNDLECMPSIINVRSLAECEEKELNAAAAVKSNYRGDRNVVDLESDDNFDNVIDLNSDVDDSAYDDSRALFKSSQSVEQDISPTKSKLQQLESPAFAKRTSAAVQYNEEFVKISDIPDVKNKTDTTKGGIGKAINKSVKESVRLTRLQKNSLEAAYRENRYLSEELRLRLARKIGLPKNAVALWFVTRREKDTTGHVEAPKLSKEHMTILETTYKHEGVPNAENQVTISHDLGIPIRKVRDWFTYRHTKGSGRASSSQSATDSKDKFRFSKEQLAVLETAFNKNPYLSKPARMKLAKEMKVPSNRIKQWFIHKRQTRKNSGNENEEHSSVIHFDSEQRKFLESEYKKDPYPTKDHRVVLADKLGVSSLKIHTWFANKRRKDPSVEHSGVGQKSNKVRFTEEQKKILDLYYKNKSYKNQEVIEKLSKELGIHSRILVRWFEKMQLDDEAEFVKDSDQLSKDHDTTDNSMVEEKSENQKESKKHRFTDEQKMILTSIYKKDKQPDYKTRVKLAEEFGVGRLQVDMWFHNKRYRDNKELASKSITESLHFNFRFNEKQKSALESAYKENKLDDEEAREKFAEKFGISAIKVDNWYNKRQLNDSEEAAENTDDLPQEQKSTYRLSKEQKNILEDIWNKYPDMETRQKLASELGIRTETIKSWFSEKTKHNKLTVPQTKVDKFEFSEEQKIILEAIYIDGEDLDEEARENLAEQFAVPSNKVHEWFSNRQKQDKEFDKTPNTHDSGSNASGSSKKARGRKWKRDSRNQLSEEQKNILETAFKKTETPDAKTKAKLSKKLGLTKTRIHLWFLHRRKKNTPSYHVNSKRSLMNKEQRRKKRVLSKNQLEILRNTYRKDKFPSKTTIAQLSKDLKLSVSKIRLFFINKRSRDKTKMKGREEESEFEEESGDESNFAHADSNAEDLDFLAHAGDIAEYSNSSLRNADNSYAVISIDSDSMDCTDYIKTEHEDYIPDSDEQLQFSNTEVPASNFENESEVPVTIKEEYNDFTASDFVVSEMNEENNIQET